MRVRYVKRNAGFSLMEVLISVLVLSIGLLGLAGLQVAGVRSGHSVYFRTQATLLANDIMDRMRTNSEAARAGRYDTDSLEPVTEDEPGEDASREEYDLYAWKRDLKDVFFPLTFDGSIGCSGDGVCRVTVQWDDSRPERKLSDQQEESRKEAASRRQFTMRTRL